MRMQEILKKVNSYHPTKINIQKDDGFHIIQFDVNDYFVGLRFKKEKSTYCYISYKKNYFFSTTNDIKLIFEYLYLILNKDVSKNVITII